MILWREVLVKYKIFIFRTEKTSVTATSTSTNMFHEEMARMRELMAKRRLLLEERRRERDRLRAENTGLVR